MASVYKNVDLIKQLISDKRLIMINGDIIFDELRRKATDQSLVRLPITERQIIYPNCFMIAYIIQTRNDVPDRHKVISTKENSLLLDHLKLVEIDFTKKKHNKNLKFSIDIMAQIRREYRNRFIVPCSFSVLKEKYKLCSAQIINILYNTSQSEDWVKLAVIEPPLDREDSKNYIHVPLGGKKKLTPEHKEKLRQASLAWHAAHPHVKPYSNQNRPVKKPKVTTSSKPTSYELIKAALEKEIKTSKSIGHPLPPARRSIFSNDDRFTDTFSEEPFDPAEVLDRTALDKTE